ncbi:TetR family transcriptional regulator C-terminal domain-containing protein [Collinsella sp. zg1085]|uniref:TetR-like C-terminal domain-containing protein n=1 Tax=Collinsella sp. zg1085 TaxID=2844380 RepID=UPI001C0AF22B|nr:TetR-like C-terminal domain-containing protein [Collinsella sp. zg1085]QWT17859.1 TetR family transcriptional regulator C-terminal domain-containing protein [Collinsella sp. zg1085]
MAEPQHKCDRRSQRSQTALFEALSAAFEAGSNLATLTVGDLTESAGLTRRTFYSHYRDIPHFIELVEDALLDEMRVRVEGIAQASLPEVYKHIANLEPAPGTVGLLEFFAQHRHLINGLLGRGGDAAFMQKIIDMVRHTIARRMKTGIHPEALGAFFDYYVSSVVAAETSLVVRWLERGLIESPATMARIMTVIAFVRPGDLYGLPIEINVPEYGLALMNMNRSFESARPAESAGPAESAE